MNMSPIQNAMIRYNLGRFLVLALICMFPFCDTANINQEMGERNTLKLTCWNARGYLSSIPYLRKVLSEVDVLAVCEHWLHSNRLSILNDIVNSHYVFARASKASSDEAYGSKRGQGGVAIFWWKDIPGFTRVCNVIHDRACMVRYQPKDGEIYFFISVYLPSQGSEEDLETVLDEISEIVESREANSHIILLGDFNGDIGVQGGPRGRRAPSRRGRYILRFFNRYGFTAINRQMDSLGPIDTFFSHNGNSTIDYIVIPEYLRANVIDCRVSIWDALNTSDHLDVRLSLQILSKSTHPIQQNSPGRIKWERQEVRIIYFLNSQGPLNELRNRISNGDVTPNLIDTYLSELTDVLHLSSENLSRTNYVKHFKPYWNAELTRLKQIKVYTYRAWVNAGRPRDPVHPLMVEYKSAKNTFSNKIKRIAKQYENDEICRAVRLAEVDRNSFWRLVKRCRNSCGSTNISIKRLDGVVVNNLPDVLEVWRHHFTNLGTPKNKDNFDDVHFREVTNFVRLYNDGNVMDDDFLSEPFTVEEIRSAVKSLNKGKAAVLTK